MWSSADGRSSTTRAVWSRNSSPISTTAGTTTHRPPRNSGNGSDPAADWFVVRSAYDVRGNLLQLIDALGRPAFIHAYDLLNRSLRVDSIDAGLRTAVLDAAGKPVETRNSRGSLVVRTYDPL